MDDFALIELVRSHPCLYNPNNQHYKNLTMRDNVWLEISKALNQPAEECKNRWRNVRDTFMRRKRKEKNRTSSRRKLQKRRKWFLQESLEFLDQIEYEKESTKQNDINHNSDEEYHPELVDIKIEETNCIETIADTNSVISGIILEHQPKRRNEEERQYNTQHETQIKKSKILEKTLDVLENSSDEKQKPAFEKKAEDEHPIDTFFKSMSTSVKRMTQGRQIRAKMKVCQLIGELELEEIACPSFSQSITQEYTSQVPQEYSVDGRPLTNSNAYNSL